MAEKRRKQDQPEKPEDGLDEEEQEDRQREELRRLWDAFEAKVDQMRARAEELLPAVQEAARRGDREALGRILGENEPFVALQWVNGAMDAGDRVLFRALLEAGYAPSQWAEPEDKDGVTLLMRAADRGDPEMVAAVLDAGAAVNDFTRTGVCALCYAAYGGHGEVVRLLLDRGAGEDPSAIYGGLMGASEAGDPELFQLLKGYWKGAPTEEDAQELEEEIAEAEAALPGNVRRAERVRQRPKPAEDPATVGLLEAALTGKLPKVVRFLGQGADVNGIDDHGATALHNAATFGYSRILRALLETPANVNACNYEGETPLHRAVLAGSAETAELLLDRGADPNAVDDEGETPFSLARRLGHVELVRLLVEQGADAGERGAEGALRAAEKAAEEDAARWQEGARGMAEFLEHAGKADAATRLRELASAFDDPAAFMEKRQEAAPEPIRVKARKRLRWEDEEEVDEIAAQIVGLGYERIGDFSVRSLSAKLRAFCQPVTSSYAVIYEQDDAGVWVDFVTFYADGGTATYSNAPFGGELAQQPGHPKTYAPTLEAPALYQQMLDERRAAPLLSISGDEFAERFEARCADEIAWRSAQG
jgi:ankyrin repeat protein